MKVNWWAVALFAAAIAWGFREGCACVKKKDAEGTVDRRTPEPIYLPGKETVIIDTQYVPEPKKLAKSKQSEIDPLKKGTIWFTGGGDGESKTIKVDENGFFGKEVTADGPTEKSTGFNFPLSPDTAYYRDSLTVAHGYAIIQDTVAGNRITGRNFRLNQALPVIKETVQAKPRNVLYLGLSGSGSKYNYLYSVEGSVSLKVKGGQLFTLGGGVTVDNRFLFRGGIAWPVRLRR
jgi:hypothetical protein